MNIVVEMTVFGCFSHCLRFLPWEASFITILYVLAVNDPHPRLRLFLSHTLVCVYVHFSHVRVIYNLSRHGGFEGQRSWGVAFSEKGLRSF